MNTKHTPGPWGISDSVLIDGPDAQSVAMPYGDTDEELEANARLIAAAPDLLAALVDLLRASSKDFNHPQSVIARDKARTAIAKATGE